MNSYSQLLHAPTWTHPMLTSGHFHINANANRVTDAGGRFVASLVPGAQLQQELARLPFLPSQASQAVQGSEALRDLTGVLRVTEAISTVGALASVANVGVSFVGFAVVLNRLSRIDGKLDDALSRLDVLVESVQHLHVKVDAMQVARLRAAGESLERSLRADSREGRLDLARRARDLFQESKHLYFELWKHSAPWNRCEIPVPTALEMQSRLVAAAIGEIQAEFICGDMGTFRHATSSAAGLIREHLMLDPMRALRERSDGVVGKGADQIVALDENMRSAAGQLLMADSTSKWTADHVASMANDADLPKALSLEPFEVARAAREATGVGYYALVRPDQSQAA